MKKIAAVIASILFTTALVSAQDFSVGARTGLGKTVVTDRISDGDMKSTWDKEFFVRYETKGRLAFEAGATQYSYQRAGIWHNSGCIVDYEPLYFEAPTSRNLLTVTDANIIDFSLGVQYDISCPAMKEKCPFMSNLHSFIGANVIGKYAGIETRQVNKRISDGSVYENNYTDRSLYDIQLGLSHTLTYDIKRVYVTSIVGYAVSISTGIFYGNWGGNNWPVDSRFSTRIGLGYRL